MSLAVAKPTVMVCPLAVDAVTVTIALLVPELPSNTVTSAIENDGSASSFVIDPIACASAIVALTGALRLTWNVSSSSNSTSPLMVTFTVALVVPAANVAVPVAAT